MKARGLWQLTIAAALLVLLAALATMQYRWLGDVSEAERARLRASCTSTRHRVCGGFRSHRHHLFQTFHVPTDRFDADPGGALADAYRSVQQALPAPVIARVYVADLSGGPDWHLQKLDVDRRTLQPAQATGDLAFLHGAEPSKPGRSARLVDTIDAVGPSLIIGLPTFRAFASGRGRQKRARSERSSSPRDRRLRRERAAASARGAARGEAFRHRRLGGISSSPSRDAAIRRMWFTARSLPRGSTSVPPT